jgi:hypothetical protein
MPVISRFFGMIIKKESMSLHNDVLLNIWNTQNFVELPPLE